MYQTCVCLSDCVCFYLNKCTKAFLYIFHMYQLLCHRSGKKTHVEMCKHTPETELVHVVCIIDSVQAAFQHNKVSSKGATPFSSAAVRAPPLGLPP